MKKLFAMVLVVIMVMLLSSFNVRAETIEPSKQPQKCDFTPSDILIPETDEGEEKDGKITLEFLKQMSSWKELANTVLPIANIDRRKLKGEDWYSVMLIESLNKAPQTIPIYHDAEYVHLCIGGISLQEIDHDRLMRKYQAIIYIYNASNRLQLVLESKILNEYYMQVDVQSINLMDLEHPATAIGQHVVVKNGAKYWESSWNDGSGRYGIATDDNLYIPEDSIVTVNGVSYLDEVRTNVIESYYKPYSEVGDQKVQIETSKRRMLHICTETTDLGWVYAEDVVRIELVRI